MTEVNLLKSIPYLLTAPSSRIWIDYDEEKEFDRLFSCMIGSSIPNNQYFSTRVALN